MFRDYVISVISTGINAQIISDDVADWIVNTTIDKLFMGCYTKQDMADLLRVLYTVRLSKVEMYVDKVDIDWRNRCIDITVEPR